MSKIKVLFDYHAKPHYLAYGRIHQLLPHISFKTGFGNILDKYALKMQSRLCFSKKPHAGQTSIISDIRNRVPETVQNVILYDTSWYKECRYVGYIQTDIATRFIRYFKQPEDSVFFHHQNQLIQKYFHGIFVTVPIVSSNGNVLVQSFVHKKRSVRKSDRIEDKIIYYTHRTLSSESIHKDIRDIIPIDFFFLCASEKKGSNLPIKVRRWMDDQKDPVSLIPVHGDMTPWNIMINADEKAVLIDYERAGWHVPYYDLFHYILQPKALDNKADSLQENLQYWEDLIGLKAKTFLILYLIDQIHFDLNSQKQFENSNKHISKMVTTKINWLNQLVDHYGSDEEKSA